MVFPRFVFIVSGAAAWLVAGRAWAEVDYVREVKPLLHARCTSCHGALKQEGGLRLDTAELVRRGGDSGPAVVPGDAEGSLVVERVAAESVDDRMPPEHEGEAFKPEEIEIVRRWIAAGAAGPVDEQPEADPRDHWAFRTVVSPPVPVIEGGWGEHPIDAFVAQGHRDHGLAPQAEAPPEVRLRRVFFDLIGLPPSADEVASVLAAPDDRWYVAAVDRLLEDPRHGERWARHWMDVWRYSDWWGLGEQLRNSQKHIWHWRDWIVDSLNADASYAEMVRQMLAADELYPDDQAKLRATGFLARNYFLFNRNQWMEETVEHVGKALMGLTMNCAKCHDHKYDPVDQQDYYRLRAFFEPYHVRLDMVPGETDLERDGVPRVYDGWPEEPTWRFVRGEESRPDKSTRLSPGVPAVFSFRSIEVQPVALPPVAWQPERQSWVFEAHAEAARRAVEAAEVASAAAGQVVAESENVLVEIMANPLPFGMVLAEPAHGGPLPRSLEGARRAVVLARGRRAVADRALSLAGTKRASVEARSAAQRASWDSCAEADAKRVVAVQSERRVLVDAARLDSAEKELALIDSPPDKKPAAENALAAAREAVTKAELAAAEPVSADARFAVLSGARWTPTRFKNSTADDPDVPFPQTSTGRRRALAEWLADPRHPLTARVAVNHIWTRHMGTPLVDSLFDFGRKGAAPTHPELLDWLAAEFVEHGWSQKHLHRLIVTSKTYRLSSSSAGASDAVAKDPDNRRLWRRVPGRLEAELVRDALLVHAGQLDSTRGGPPVLPAAQAESKRRSLYFFHSNNDRNLLLTTFDGAAVKECYRREQSIVPQQALALSNSRLVLDAARAIAERLSQATSPNAAPPDDEGFIRRAWLELLAIEVADAEREACHRALERWRQLEPADPLAARTHLIWTLLNHNDFVTLR